MRLVVATYNAGKLQEFRQLLANLGMKLVSCAELTPPVPDVKETGTTFAENALLKAQAVTNQTGEVALADDSGFVVDYLNGAPGVYSKRFVPGSDADRNRAVLTKLSGVPVTQRGAAFVAVLCLTQPGQEPVYFEGRVTGTVAESPRGEHGFGYDPIFIPEGYTQTFSELGADVKNTISHRARAIEKLREYLNHNYT
jgi:XTP/dITP diphosphohydrolase